MNQVTDTNIPKLGAKRLSAYIADLVLAGAGEEPALKHPRTRTAWHLFFFSTLIFFLLHMIVRVAVVPASQGTASFKVAVRTLEMGAYAYLIAVLAYLIYCHHRFMLIPRLSCRFATLVFFMILMVLLFSRLNYSLYQTGPEHFSMAQHAVLPTSEFGIHGAADLAGVLEFTTLSGCTILNTSYVTIQPKSMLACFIAMVESGIGYLFVAILIATSVEITADRRRI